MKPANRKDSSMLTEAYTQITEGMFDRMGARVAGAGQYLSNIGKAVTGQTSSTSPQAAQMQSILTRSAKDFLTNIYKLGLVPGAEKATPDDAQIKSVVQALKPLMLQLQAQYGQQQIQQQQKQMQQQQQSGVQAAQTVAAPAGTTGPTA